MIDIHSHLLPGLDDGPQSMDETVMMCRLAARDGIHHIVATPHAMDGRHQPCPDKIRKYVRLLNAALVKNNIALTIHCGAEARLVPNMHAEVTESPWLRLAGSRYVLVEPPALLPQRLKEEIFQMRLAGFIPILAHPERCGCVQQNPELLIPLVAAGMMVQITAQSLLGDFGISCRLCAETLINSRTAHILATDAHSVQYRPPLMSEALTLLKELIGEEEALAMVRTRPDAILRDQRITLPEPQPGKIRTRQPFLARLGMAF